MRKTVLAAAALLALLGCNSAPQDGGRVLANVGGQKITEAEFKAMVDAMAQNPQQAKEFLESPLRREERARMLGDWALSKALVTYAKAQGVDQDPKVRARLEQAMAQAYFRILVEQRLAKVEPSEAQLKATYDELVAQRRAAGQDQGLPAFEQVKAQMPDLWRQKRAQEVQGSLLDEVKAALPITLADDVKPVAQP